MNRKNVFLVVFVAGLLLCPAVSYASVESTLTTIQTKLIGTILPLAAILGLVFASFSFVMGSPSARSHLYLAIIGSMIGFGAPSIIAFIRGMVQ